MTDIHVDLRCYHFVITKVTRVVKFDILSSEEFTVCQVLYTYPLFPSPDSRFKSGVMDEIWVIVNRMTTTPVYVSVNSASILTTTVQFDSATTT